MKTNIYYSPASAITTALTSYFIFNQKGSAVPAHKNNTGQPVFPGLGKARPESAEDPKLIPGQPAKTPDPKS